MTVGQPAVLPTVPSVVRMQRVRKGKERLRGRRRVRRGRRRSRSEHTEIPYIFMCESECV